MISNSHINAISAALIVTAILGPILPGLEIAGNNIFLYRILVVILLPVLLVAVLIRNNSQLQISREELLFCAFGIYLIFLLSFTPSVASAASASSVVLLPIFTGILIAVSIQDRGAVEVQFGILVVLLSLSMIIAMWELSTGQHLATSRIPSLPDRFSHYMSAWYYNQNDFSAFVAILSPLFFVKLLHGGQTQRIFSIVTFGTIGVVMYQQLPRAALLGILVTTVVCVLIFRFRQLLIPVKNEASTLLSITPFVGVLVVVGAVILIDDTFLLENRSILIRWRLLRVAVHTASSTIIGTGLGSLHITVQQSTIDTFGFVTPHSWLTWLLAVTGIPGTILFLSLLGSLLRRHLGNYLENGDPISLATIGIIISFGIAGTGPSNIFYMEGIWILFGILATTTRIIRTRDNKYEYSG